MIRAKVLGPSWRISLGLLPTKPNGWLKERRPGTRLVDILTSDIPVKLNHWAILYPGESAQSIFTGSRCPRKSWRHTGPRAYAEICWPRNKAHITCCHVKNILMFLNFWVFYLSLTCKYYTLSTLVSKICTMEHFWLFSVDYFFNISDTLFMQILIEKPTFYKIAGDIFNIWRQQTALNSKNQR